MSSVVVTKNEALVETIFTGQTLLDNPLLNKGSAFSEDERRDFGCFHCIVRRLMNNSLAPTKTTNEKKAISSAMCF
jgi:hypothetical protein